MAKYSILEPSSLDEALEFLDKYTGDIKPIAGGTDLLIDFRYGKTPPSYLLDLATISELNYINSNGALEIGAATVLNDIAHNAEIQGKYTMLAEGTGCIGSYQIRNLATMGGNVCNAVPSADAVPALLAANAQVKIQSKGGTKTMAIEDFFLGPRKNALQLGELVTGFEIPKADASNGSVYFRYTHRKALDLAVVGAAVRLTVTPDLHIRDATIALGAVAPVPIRIYDAENLLKGKPYSEELADQAAALAVTAAKPISDVRSSAEYRNKIIRVYVRRAISEAYKRALTE